MIKVAINGFGRIGRAVFKNIIDDYPELELVAVNDLAEKQELIHLLKHDTVYGKYEKEIKETEEGLKVGGSHVKLLQKQNPSELPWDSLDVDVALECTGVFRTKEDAGKHLQAGAEKVLISAPAKSEGIDSYVLGVNEDSYQGEEIADMGSCTTNCLAPVVKVLNDNFGLSSGLMTTIHSYTVSQNLLDGPGAKDYRRNRAAAENIVPTSTGAAKAISKVIPEVEGKLDGMAMRVPTPTVSVVDLVCTLNEDPSVDKINESFKKAADSEKMEKVFNISEKPLVSSDYIQNPYSSVVDAEMTRKRGETYKIISWYDNEWGYARRMVDFVKYMAKN